MFIGRNKELGELEEFYNRYGFRLFMISGKRGIGKTTLIQEFCKDKNTIFFTAQPDSSSRQNLIKFSAKVLSHYPNEKITEFNFWEDALQYVNESHKGERIVLVIDDFTEISEKDPAFLVVLSKIIEQKLLYGNIFLILSSNNQKVIDSFLIESFSSAAKRITKAIHIENFLTDEAIDILQKVAMKTSKGIDRTKFIRFSSDEIILKEGGYNTDVYKIVSGQAIAYLNHNTENEYILSRLKEGDFFGEYGFLTRKPALYTVVAYSDVLLLRLREDELQKFIELNVSNATNIIKGQAKMLGVLKFHMDMLLEELKEKDNPK